jgi:MFS family permease
MGSKFFELLNDAVGKKHTSRLQSYKGTGREIAVIFYQLVAEPIENDLEQRSVDEADGFHPDKSNHSQYICAMESLRILLQRTYGGIPVGIWWLSLTQLVNRTGTMLVFFLAVYLEDALRFSLEDVGWLMAIYGSGSIAGVLSGGRLSDRYGWRPVMLLSLFLGGCAFFVVAALQSFLSLSIGLFMLSFLGEAFRPANFSAIASFTTKENYTRSVTLNRLAINLGFAVGPAVGGWLAFYDFTYIFWADGITCIAACGIVIFFLGKDKMVRLGSAVSSSEKNASRSPYRDRYFLYFLPFVGIYAVCFFQYFNTMPLYYTNVQGFTTTDIGWLTALNGILVGGVEMFLITHIERKNTAHRFIQWGALLLTLSYLLVMVVHGLPWFFVVMIIISFSEMLAMPFMNTLMNNRAIDGKRGQYAALYGLVWSLAQIISPVLSTQTINRFGYQALWLVMALLSVSVIWGMGRLQRKFIDP